MRPDELRRIRIQTAYVKIQSVLRAHIACHQKELERRVCEVGFSFYPLAPREQRPEPVHLTEARKQLEREDRIDSVSRSIGGNRYRFYFLTDADHAAVREAIERKAWATREVDRLHHAAEYSGHCVERLYWSALIEDRDTYVAYPYEPGRDYRAVNGAQSDRGVDLVAVHLPTHHRIVAEVKNIREWIYPDSEHLWALLGAAAQLGALPLLIARRIAEPTFLFFRDIGAFGHPTYHMFIDHQASALPHWSDFERACALLGYKDVKAIDPTHPTRAARRLFRSQLPSQLPRMADKFGPLRERILSIAKGEELWKPRPAGRLSRQPRHAIVSKFWAEIRSAPPPEI